MVSSIEMQWGDESVKYVDISKFLKGKLDPWKNVMGERYHMVTGDYSGLSGYVQTAQRKVVGPDGVERPLIVEKASGPVPRTIYFERFWKRKKIKRGQRVTTLDGDDGEVTEVAVSLIVVDEKDIKLEIDTNVADRSFYQKTSCGLRQTIELLAKPLVVDAERFVAAASALRLPIDLCNFEEKLIANINEDGIKVYRRTRTIYKPNGNNYPITVIFFQDKYLLPGSGENKGLGHVPPMNEVK